MSNSQYDEELAGLGELYGQMLSEMAAEGDSVFHIDFNDDLTWFGVTTYSSEVGNEEEYYVSAVYALSVCYHIFAGTEPEAITIEFVNYPTGVSLGVLDSRNL